MENTSILSLFLPSGMLDYFTIDSYEEYVDSKTKNSCIKVHLTEKSLIPEGYKADEFESKGFVSPVVVQDFPIRGKQIFLSLKCRRWRRKDDKSVTIRRDFSFLADGVKMTTDLVDFLKDTGRDPSQYVKRHL